MKSDSEHLLLVSRATMVLLTGSAPYVRIECETAVIPPLRADDDGPLEVDGVTSWAFVWS